MPRISAHNKDETRLSQIVTAFSHGGNLMNIDKKTYKKFADAHAPKSPLVKDCLWAFCVGGGICAFAQGLKDIYMKICGIPEIDAGTWPSTTPRRSVKLTTTTSTTIAGKPTASTSLTVI